MTCETAKKLGVKLEEYDFPAWPDDVLQAPPDYWLKLLGKQATVQSFFGKLIARNGLEGLREGSMGTVAMEFNGRESEPLRGLILPRRGPTSNH